ncbi:restriction endonuclease subunit S [Limosilactobacillus reuteri subsp. suis]|uniref:restriction endonuclease subunit S n=1 Tax=Limosilactobacillus reuteri TaxID=1598 RepID=UPI0039934CD3
MKYRLGDLLYIKGRIGWKGLKKKEYLDKGDYRIINGTNIINGKVNWSSCGFISKERYNESPEIMLKANDILITKDGTIGKVAIVEELSKPSTVASGIFILRNTSPNIWITKYLYYYLQSYDFKSFIHSRIEGSVIPHLYQKDFESLSIKSPSLEEQNTISRRLELIDKKIDLNNQLNDNLVELINLIYLKFCADFPAKEKVSLDDVFNTSTKTFNVNENKNINIWHFSIPNFDCNKQPQCESTNSIKSNKKKVNSFGVLVSKLNPNFKRIWAPNLDFYSNYSPIASPEFIQINGNSQEEQALIFCILNSEEYTDFLVSNTTGSTNSRQRVKPKIAVSYIIPFDLDKKKGLESLVSPILKDIQQREFENTKLQIIKDTVLNKYF